MRNVCFLGGRLLDAEEREWPQQNIRPLAAFSSRDIYEMGAVGGGILEKNRGSVCLGVTIPPPHSST
jgi:hypothetical protein